ncbi:carbohydrate kinase [Tribonema minus]|uniref:Carbohydrate kinase n=1 Tax=Tribonema minus TaxID=303371 RepID=A0A836CG13_9STRA|nr:carbohydrate kinase [Tribonema minus]
MSSGPQLSIGFDYGTSGARAVVIDSATKTVQHVADVKWTAEEGYDSPQAWLSAAAALLDDVPAAAKARMARICVSGTSASCLLVERSDPLAVTRGPAMYNYNTLRESPAAAAAAAAALERVAPPLHTTLSGTSALMKLLTWHAEAPLGAHEALAHQADYVSAYMRGGAGAEIVTDWNNALKTGFDVEQLRWPDWLRGLHGGAAAAAVPRVVRPGAVTGAVGAAFARRHGLPPRCEVAAGTTDSIAAFLAADGSSGGGGGAGHAVTSLGSTLALKLLSATRVEDASRGVYSHRLGDGMWLVGGASNTGCAVFRQLGFSDAELAELSADMSESTGEELGEVYYPLAGQQGERFPFNDPDMKAILEPVPASRGEYLAGLLQSLARVEAEGYALLHELGALPALAAVATAGGGANNGAWSAMRARRLGVPVTAARNGDAAYGVALLGLAQPLPVAQQ